VLTRINPASYGMDALRRVVLHGSGVPKAVLDRLGLTIGGQTLSLWIEAAVLAAFGAVMLALAIVGFRQRD
jgi:ABC-2 type transport system permease protein